MSSNIYQEKGYENRKDYLRSVAIEYGIDLETVCLLADVLGPNEDFDGLISELECYDFRNPLGFWDSKKIIGIVSKNDWGKEVQVKKVSKGTREYIDVRFYEKDGELLPGEGISIPIDVAHEIGVLILNETEKE